MDRRVTSPTWGPPPPCKQALNHSISRGLQYTAFFFPTCHALKTWFELSRVKLYRNPLKGTKITSS